MSHGHNHAGHNHAGHNHAGHNHGPNEPCTETVPNPNMPVMGASPYPYYPNTGGASPYPYYPNTGGYPPQQYIDPKIITDQLNKANNLVDPVLEVVAGEINTKIKSAFKTESYLDIKVNLEKWRSQINEVGVPKVPLLKTKNLSFSPTIKAKDVKWVKNPDDTATLLSHYLNIFGQSIGADVKRNGTEIDFDFHLKPNETIHDKLSLEKMKDGFDELILKLSSDLQKNNTVKDDGFSRTFVGMLLDKVKLFKGDSNDMFNSSKSLTDSLSDSMYALANARNDFALEVEKTKKSIFTKIADFFKNLFTGKMAPETRIQAMNGILEEMDIIRTKLSNTRIDKIDKIALNNMTFSINLQLTALERKGGLEVDSKNKEIAQQQINKIREQLASINDLTNTSQGLAPDVPNILEDFKKKTSEVLTVFGSKGDENQNIFIIQSLASTQDSADKMSSELGNFKDTAYFEMEKISTQINDFISDSSKSIDSLGGLIEKMNTRIMKMTIDFGTDKNALVSNEIYKALQGIKENAENKVKSIQSNLKNAKKDLTNKILNISYNIQLATSTQLDSYAGLLTSFTQEDIVKIKKIIKEIGKDGKSMGKVMDKIPGALKIIKFIDDNNIFSDTIDTGFAISIAIFKAKKSAHINNIEQMNIIKQSLVSSIDSVLETSSDKNIILNKIDEYYAEVSHVEKSNKELYKFVQEMIASCNKLRGYKHLLDSNNIIDSFTRLENEIANTKEMEQLQGLISSYKLDIPLKSIEITNYEVKKAQEKEHKTENTGSQTEDKGGHGSHGHGSHGHGSHGHEGEKDKTKNTESSKTEQKKEKSHEHGSHEHHGEKDKTKNTESSKTEQKKEKSHEHGSHEHHGEKDKTKNTEHKDKIEQPAQNLSQRIIVEKETQTDSSIPLAPPNLNKTNNQETQVNYTLS
jgi:hypothetical protein